MTKSIVYIIIATFVLSAVTGCDFIGDIIADKVSEKVTEEVAEQVIEKAIEDERGGEAEVDLSSGKVNIKGKDGTVALGNGTIEIPKDFPADVVIPPNVTFRMAMSEDGNHSLGGITNDSIQTLSAQVSKDAKANGWIQKKKMDIGQMQIIHYEKDGRSLIFKMGSSNNKRNVEKSAETFISIAVQKSKTATTRTI